MREYPRLNEIYHNHEGKVSDVKVLSIATHYGCGEEYVVYQAIHTGTIGVIKLSEWDKIVDPYIASGYIFRKPRFFQN